MTDAPLRVVIVGAGKVGSTLGVLWHQAEGVELIGVTAHGPRAHQLVAHLQIPLLEIEALPSCDVVALCTPESAFAACVAQLTPQVSQFKLVMHLSGAVDRTVLAPLQRLGVSTAAVHVLHSFAADIADIAPMDGTPCGVDSDDIGTALCEHLFGALNGHCFSMQKVDRTQYHAAAVVASNSQFVIVEAAKRLFIDAGIDADKAQTLAATLATSTSSKLYTGNIAHKLTGPAVRGERAIVQKQLDSIADPKIKALYQLMRDGLLALKR
ncbi:MAG: DUF2520 domain-containing protein [Gammaproteobacteria bacterium]|nr:DUF2520 domain-containing protein [Gammaproteobacteria bacterium]